VPIGPADDSFIPIGGRLDIVARIGNIQLNVA
jgi:hypothetical protein